MNKGQKKPSKQAFLVSKIHPKFQSQIQQKSVALMRLFLLERMIFASYDALLESRNMNPKL